MNVYLIYSRTYTCIVYIAFVPNSWPRSARPKKRPPFWKGGIMKSLNICMSLQLCTTTFDSVFDRFSRENESIVFDEGQNFFIDVWYNYRLLGKIQPLSCGFLRNLFSDLYHCGKIEALTKPKWKRTWV